MKRSFYLCVVALFCAANCAAQDNWAPMPSLTSYLPLAYVYPQMDSAAVRVCSAYGYAYTPYVQSTKGRGTCNLTSWNEALASGAGILYVTATHGATIGLSFESYGTNADSAGIMANIAYMQNELKERVYYAGTSDGHTIAMYYAGSGDWKGVQQHYTGGATAVFLGACYTNSGTGAFGASSAQVTFSGTPTFATIRSNFSTIFERMSGVRGISYRMLTAAASGTSVATPTGTNTSMVLAPTVVDIIPSGAQIRGGDQVEVMFDTPMDFTGNPAAVLVGCYPVSFTDQMWVGYNTIRGTIHIAGGTKCDGRIIVSGFAATSGSGVALDGNTRPWGKDGVIPNGDDWIVVISANAAADFEMSGAWQAADGLHVWWSVDERGSQSYQVYLGEERGQLLGTVPAQGNGPQYYEAVYPIFGTAGQTAEIVELGSDLGESSSRPFLIEASEPTNLNSLRQLNAVRHNWGSGNGNTTRVICGACPIQEPTVTDFVYVGMDSTWFPRVKPVQDWWFSNRGMTSQNVLLHDNSPQTVRQTYVEILNAAIEGNYPRVPYLVILGEANQGGNPERNIINTLYIPDPDSICYWGCVSDGFFTDANGDTLPDAPWSRVVVHTTAQLDSAVNIALVYYAAQHSVSPRVVMLDGNRDANCMVTCEPTTTLAGIQAQYTAHNIPVTALYDSATSCSDYAGKLNQLTSALATPATEIFMIGDLTNRNIWCYFAQRSHTPYCMALPGTSIVVVEGPGCGFLDFWRNNADTVTSYPTIGVQAQRDSRGRTRAVALLGHMTGGPKDDHCTFAKKFTDKRFDPQPDDWCLQLVYQRAIVQTALDLPSMRNYLKGAGSLGWPVITSDMERATAVGELPRTVSLDFRNAPNPAHGAVNLQYTLPSVNWVSLAVYNAAGQRVAELVPRTLQSANAYTVRWNTSEYAAGVYFSRLTVGTTHIVKKIVVW